MCASYGLKLPADLPVKDEQLPLEELIAWLAAQPPGAGSPIRPTGPKARNYAPIVTPQGVESSWWGMWVGGAPSKFSTINATAERLTTGLWRSPFARGRVLVPATEYYEYAGAAPGSARAKKTRHAFRLPDGAPFAIAGIAAPIPVAPRPEPTGDLLSELGFDPVALPATSYAIVTRPPTEAAATVHDRMPLVLPASFSGEWLDPANAGDEGLRAAALAASDELALRLVHEPVG